MSTTEIRDWLIAALEAESLHTKTGAEYMPDHFHGAIDRVRTLVDADVYTRMDGIVVQMDSGAEFQITVHQTRHATVKPG